MHTIKKSSLYQFKLSVRESCCKQRIEGMFPLGFHYIINMVPNISEKSIKYATTCQNLHWAERFYPYRIEYLGTEEDDLYGLTDNLLVTGMFKQITRTEEFERILQVFISFLEDVRSDYLFMSFYQVTAEEVKRSYNDLKDNIDSDWFLAFDDFSVSTYETIKKLYYDFHLESLLYSGLREEYEEYHEKRTNPPVLTEAQQLEMKKIDAKLSIFGETGVLPKRIHGSDIIYGKYHLSSLRNEATIPPYSKRAKGLRTSILDFAFDGCDGLERVTIYDDISHFGDFVFRGCSDLKYVRLNSNMEMIPDNTFLNCTSLQEVEIPETIKVIGKHAFCSCQSLSDADLFSNTSLETIEQSAFYDCRRLKSLVLPETLREIGNYAFSRSGIVKITIPGNVSSIGTGAFMECKSLRSIILPNSITEISPLCFSECTELESVTLCEGVVRIQDNAFTDCSKLKEIVIPYGVEEIGEEAFKGCTSLTSITIPGSVTRIGEYCFSGCTELRSITLCEGVIEVGEGAFSDCGKLEDIVILNGTELIGEDIFDD